MTDQQPRSRTFFDRALVRNNGIARRMLAMLILFSSAITAIITAMELYIDYRADIRGIDARIESIRKVYLPSLTESVWVAERSQIQTQLDGLRNLTDIEFVGIESDGRIIWSSGARESSRQIEQVIPLIRAYRGQGVNIGELHVVASVDNVLARLGSKLVVILVSNGIKTFLVGIFLLLFFQASVGQHLEHISAYLRRVGRSLSEVADLRLNRPASGRWRPDALDHVTHAINSMRGELSHFLAELTEAKQKLETIVRSSPLAIYTTDLNGVVTSWSPSAEKIFGWPAAEIVGERVPAAAQREGRDPEDLCRRVLGGETFVDVETQHRKRDGSLIDVSITLAPLHDSSGQTHGCLRIAADIEQRKAMEEQLRQSQRMEAVGQLTGGVAHDFNNLLGVISGNLELLAEALEDRRDVRNMLQTAIRATDRGATLTRSLLAFARQQPLEPRPLDPNELIREMAELWRRTVPENIEMQLVAASTWLCEADPGQLQNAMLNLVANARDAMPAGGRLTIETHDARLDDAYAAAHAEVAPGDYLMLAVSDSGVGMTPAVAARAFDPFFTTKEVGKGTGLGLSMVYGFAKQSRGHVSLYSEVGEGTTVRIYLPRSAAGADQWEAPERSDDMRGRGETILVVEDDADFRTLTFALLRSLGYEVLDAGSAQAALRMLREGRHISLLLTDVVLPGGMNGPQLAEEALRLHPHIGVIYMSGYTENAILHHGRVDPGVNLLQKPFRKHDLAAKVRAVLARDVPS
jgi:PAS domain S-box-containing protein